MNATRIIFVPGLMILAGYLIALTGMLTSRDDGSAGRPRWPARYPPGPRRDIFGDVRRCVATVIIMAAVMSGPVSEEDWDAACRRAGWEPSDDGEQVRT